MNRRLLNQCLNRFNLHLSLEKDPGLIHIKRKFLESALETFGVIAEALIRNAGLKTFAQIGANDGVHNDGLGRLIQTHGLRGVMVEPQPHAAALLRQRYADRPEVHVVESAVGSHEGKLTLWRTVGLERSGKTKLDALTTADRRLLERQIKLMGLQCEIESLEVPVLPLTQILQQHQLAKPEIVVIDTEGMDRIVLDQVDLHEHGPAVIQFEASHLNSKDLAACHSRLAGRGYRFTLTERDVIAVHPAYVSAVAS